MERRTDWIEALLPGLRRLDGLLDRDEPSKGAAAPAHAPFDQLRRAFGLSEFDLDLVLVALGPELDPRYGDRYAGLQSGGAYWPSVELALSLLCTSAREKFARRAHLDDDAPLLRHGLLRLVTGQSEREVPVHALYLRLDGGVTAHLLGRRAIDVRLAATCTRIEPGGEPPPVERRTMERIEALARGRVLYVSGPPGVGKRSVAATLAHGRGAPLLTMDLARCEDGSLAILLRQARLEGAVVCLAGLDVLHERDAGAFDRCMTALLAAPGPIVLTGTKPWESLGDVRPGVPAVALPVPGPALRRVCWLRALDRAGAALDDEELDLLAERFRLTPGQIEAATDLASGEDAPSYENLAAEARRRTGHELATMAVRIEPRRAWSELVLPPDRLGQLREVCVRAAHRGLVYEDWGFAGKCRGTGLNVLFHGPSGTGKTMAAEVVAGELGFDLYAIDLAQVVSKYVGETEKNLDRVFSLAERTDGVLFFDEADALYGRRSEVRDAHDRYANIETGYLLQKMEQHAGITILATNLRQHLDEAFTRRLDVIVEFPLPDEEQRRRLWEVVFPAEAPLGDDVDLGLLARDIRLPGGGIQNIALAAAFYAAANGQVIDMAHLDQASVREHRKHGRVWAADAWTVRP
ncbi:ATP-binding protein [Streptomyces sp. UC4497]